MSKLYPQVSVPKPLDQNRHAIVMELAKGSLLSKTKLVDPEWYLDEILKQVKITYSRGVIHADLSEYNIFVSEEGVQLIDWPQYVILEHPHADEILERDVSNILTHFSRKYNIKRELEKVLEEVKSGEEKSSVNLDNDLERVKEEENYLERVKEEENDLQRVKKDNVKKENPETEDFEDGNF
jgi:RIO kinase 2